MKLIRFGEIGKEKPGVCINDINYDVSGFIQDYNAAFFSNGGLLHLAWMVDQHKTMLRKIAATERIGCPVAMPSKIVCIGLNYADHAKETNAATPTEPIIFLKSSSAVCGPFDNIIIPKNSFKTDYEAELAIVIGKKASYVSEADALNYIAGYSIMNDYSEREFQMEKAAGQWD